MIYFIFVATGYIDFSFSGFALSCIPIYGIGTGFIGSFLVFYLCIPFVNILIKNMDEKMHLLAIALGLSVYTIIPSFLDISVACNYVIWFIIIYLIAAYIRLYPKPFMEKRGLWGILTLIALVLSWISVLAGIYEFKMTGNRDWYFWVADSNKILALVTAVCAFMFFKNLHLGYNPIINRIAASAFGVLLIHANSDAMRKWLWIDTLKNKEMLTSEYFFVHAIASVIIIYVICTVIDMLRIAFVEKPVFNFLLSHKILK